MQTPVENPNKPERKITPAAEEEKAALQKALQQEGAATFYLRLERENAGFRAAELIRQRRFLP